MLWHPNGMDQTMVRKGIDRMSFTVARLSSRPGWLVALLAAGASCMSVLEAEAHVSPNGYFPARNGRATTSIDVVQVAFTGPLRSGTLSVRGPRGTVSSGRGGRDPRKISRLIVPLKCGLVPGRYRASWTVVAADGHRQSGSFLFTLVR